MVSSTYTKNGKWSSTSYTIRINEEKAEKLELVAPLHGVTWSQASAAEALASMNNKLTLSRVSEEEFAAAIGRDYPKTAERWAASAAAQGDL